MPRTLSKARGRIRGAADALLAMVVFLSMACASHNSTARNGLVGGTSSVEDTPPATSTWCVAEPLRSAEGAAGVEGPLAELNVQFLQAHARARAHQCMDLGTNRLVLRYSFGLFEARFRGQEIARTSVLPKEYHPVKDVSHAVFLSALLFSEAPGAERDQHITLALAALDSALRELRDPSSLTATLLPPSLHQRELRLLQQTRDALAKFSHARLGPDAQEVYFASVRSDVQSNLRDVAAASLRTLHGAVESTRSKVAELDPKAWDSVLIVVGVMHQARAREIGIQYFERLLDERVGEGARNERRLVVAEHVTVPSEQMGLLSAHLVDQEGAAAIFGDRLRLQWDALGDVNPATLDGFFHR
jgi:hypothetical protein